MSLEELAELTPAIGLDTVAKGLSPLDHQLDHIVVGFPQYLRDLSGTLSQTQARTWQAFFIWRAAVALEPLTSAPELRSLSALNRQLSGIVS